VLSSLLASFHNKETGDDYGQTAATAMNASTLSILASWSSEHAATITKVTPHVLTTLPPFTTSAKPSTNGLGQFLESQTGSSAAVISSISRAGGVAVNGRGGLTGRERGVTGMWDMSAGIWGLFVGFLGGFFMMPRAWDISL
jgi:hypothetical protein